MNLVYALCVGVVMGVLLQRIGASSPRMIAAALRLENLQIIKFMFTTVAVGMIATYALSQFVPMHFDIKPTYLAGVALGGIIFGVGFALGGYCPGTCVVGVGEGRRDAWAAVIGGVVGAVAFTAVYTLLERLLIKPMNYGKVTLPQLLHMPPLLIAVIVGVLFLTVVTLLPTTRSAGKA
ncbi:MAG TPA: YeeE/YedE thiosulfate transporter family protein [Longimicrobiales bacterium]